MVTRREDKQILEQFLGTKVCVWNKESSDKIIGILKDFDKEHLLIKDEKTKMTILVGRDEFFKIEVWGATDE